MTSTCRPLRTTCGYGFERRRGQRRLDDQDEGGGAALLVKDSLRAFGCVVFGVSFTEFDSAKADGYSLRGHGLDAWLMSGRFCTLKFELWALTLELPIFFSATYGGESNVHIICKHPTVPVAN